MACFRLVLLLVASRRSDALQPTVNKIVGQLGVGSGGGTTDVILSSGFCCFSSHCGFLDALEASSLSIGALVGTSSGSLAASLYACGLSAEAVAAELAAKAPVRECRLSRTPWRGALSTRALVKRLARVLPPRFEDLGVPLGVGVYDWRSGATRLVTSGPLPEAVAASCAVPRLFSPVYLDGAGYLDGGGKDRTFLEPYRAWRPARPPPLVHLVKDRGVPLEPRDGVRDGDGDVRLLQTDRSATAKLWNLGAFAEERLAAADAARAQLGALYPEMMVSS